MNRLRYQLLAVILPLVFAVDQLTKLWIVRHLQIGESFTVIPGLFDIVHITNRGAAFGFMSQLPDHLRIPFFHATSLLAVAAIGIYFIKSEESTFGPYVALSLILGGATGNIFDRLVRGEVVDFLSFHWYDAWATILNWHFKVEWPSFNVADMAISCSVAWLIARGFKK